MYVIVCITLTITSVKQSYRKTQLRGIGVVSSSPVFIKDLVYAMRFIPCTHYYKIHIYFSLTDIGGTGLGESKVFKHICRKNVC